MIDVPKRIIICSKNPNKILEIKKGFKNLPCEISIPSNANLPDVLENGRSYGENASKKATCWAKFLNSWVIAEDSGLEVKALNNRPGIMSARYAGNSYSPNDNIKKLLDELVGLPLMQRSARFICIMALANPKEIMCMVRGTCNGFIIFSQLGKHGFGYDPVFLFPKLGRTFSEMSLEEKLLYSHRGRAIRKLAYRILSGFKKTKLIK
jgi:XTP/dITP diphosphohydrolase